MRFTVTNAVARRRPGISYPVRRTFDSREDLHRYLQSMFPEAAARDPHISPIKGGLQAAQARLERVDPETYAGSRNYLDGCVTRLSPYIRHGVLTLAEVRDQALAIVPDPQTATKFITELAWREYWQRLYYQLGNAVWEDREEYKTGHPPQTYAKDLPADIENGATNLACIDAFSRDLRETGYLHNHARMWMAAYVVHWRKIQWRAGARWFLQHLLDGDPASNNLSWQWVASTFSNKPYFFNRENLERYSSGIYCRACPSRGVCPFDASYEVLEQRLFKIGR